MQVSGADSVPTFDGHNDCASFRAFVVSHLIVLHSLAHRQHTSLCCTHLNVCRLQRSLGTASKHCNITGRHPKDSKCSSLKRNKLAASCQGTKNQFPPLKTNFQKAWPLWIYRYQQVARIWISELQPIKTFTTIIVAYNMHRVRLARDQCKQRTRTTCGLHDGKLGQAGSVGWVPTPLTHTRRTGKGKERKVNMIIRGTTRHVGSVSTGTSDILVATGYSRQRATQPEVFLLRRRL